MGHVEDAKEDVLAFVTKRFEELRSALRQTQPGHDSIGLTTCDALELQFVPSGPSIRPGMYVSNDGGLHVEVLRQSPETGMVHVESYNIENDNKQFDMISPTLFVNLFRSNHVPVTS